jgi:hypothetical protein
MQTPLQQLLVFSRHWKAKGDSKKIRKRTKQRAIEAWGVRTI